MNTIEFLTALASMPAFQPEVKTLIAAQPPAVQDAFREQNAQALKHALQPRPHEITIHERTVTEI
ncbi:hypothetical protein AQUSIP_04840 [Aquicella siphonis]|uniref:Uncharacterized protein n=1 Tax=Aquicella siphonis TaxID=254247 RepID=A0A5E4PFJ7_9COXI|nr:hypothetical protein [Aquicella siphonis]VVC75197.1 hypothetical protein AQUSIP_04840 [Aquicella siphonis]